MSRDKDFKVLAPKKTARERALKAEAADVPKEKGQGGAAAVMEVRSFLACLGSRADEWELKRKGWEV